ncbi:MAG: mandelate racemase/muconate lactonizing enzyme family protein [Planctomycetaceae bacterium]|nr:mandelate racemase/muconate lactonizing enzyme family protein [Planctomycetaceae bacterium]
MGKPTDLRIKEVTTDTQRIEYRAPMKFGGRVVTDVVIFNVTVAVETNDGRQGVGRGSMPIGNVWGWPSDRVSNEDTLAAMVALAERIAEHGGQADVVGHPLEITTALANDYDRFAEETIQRLELGESMPRLAQLVAGSPWEAALFDAQGQALEQNIYNLLSSEYVNADLAHWLGDDFRGEYLDQYTLREPKPQMPLYHLVGALDPLTEAEIPSRLNDGSPETLSEWIHSDGLTHLKIKLNGDDLDWDVGRVLAVDSVASEAQQDRNCNRWFYSLDFNEKCQNVEYVLEFLNKVQSQAMPAFDRVQYIEQPTSRYLSHGSGNQMDQAAKLKPVVIDESLVDLESLLLSRELGYSGVALKACKGHSEALLMGAAAQKHQMFLCVQDLTCPGASFLHSASLAARIPTVAAIEGNGRQYCPAGNAGWRERYPSMFEINDGTVGTHVLNQTGLGFRWE